MLTWCLFYSFFIVKVQKRIIHPHMKWNYQSFHKQCVHFWDHKIRLDLRLFKTMEHIYWMLPIHRFGLQSHYVPRTAISLHRFGLQSCYDPRTTICLHRFGHQSLYVPRTAIPLHRCEATLHLAGFWACSRKGELCNIVSIEMLFLYQARRKVSIPTPHQQIVARVFQSSDNLKSMHQNQPHSRLTTN